eukprot:TRINITY_DN8612_c0_g1_i2.p1 TRINITY_DN8612_c0_g1~~TRINITY_DN8612_c0_g1_i2.p1  ORF type:complete len:206 (-),score=24.19 TRINITY_DN8612_c0_g1_i2:36-653(-)
MKKLHSLAVTECEIDFQSFEFLKQAKLSTLSFFYMKLPGNLFKFLPTSLSTLTLFGVLGLSSFDGLSTCRVKHLFLYNSDVPMQILRQLPPSTYSLSITDTHYTSEVFQYLPITVKDFHITEASLTDLQGVENTGLKSINISRCTTLKFDKMYPLPRSLQSLWFETSEDLANLDRSKLPLGLSLFVNWRKVDLPNSKKASGCEIM